MFIKVNDTVINMDNVTHVAYDDMSRTVYFYLVSNKVVEAKKVAKRDYEDYIVKRLTGVKS